MIRFALVLLIVVAAAPAWAGVTLGTVTTNFSSFSDTVTVSGVTCSGSNRYAVAFVHWAADQTVSSVKRGIGGTDLTRHGGVTHSGYAVDIWKWNQANGQIPATSADYVVQMSGAVSQRIRAAVICFSDVDQTTPLDTIVVDPGSVTNPQPTVDVTSAVGDFVIDGITTDDGAITASQTQRWQIPTNGPPNGAGSTADGATTVTMAWSDLALFSTYSHVATNVNAATGGGGGGGQATRSMHQFRMR